MRVLRIEHRDSGEGPYRSYKPTGVATDWSEPCRPCPQMDGIATLQKCACGFASEEQLRAWFNNRNELENMRNCGYVAREFHAFEVYQGGRQVVFRRETSHPVAEYDLLDFAPPADRMVA